MKSVNGHAGLSPEACEHQITGTDGLLLKAQELIQRARADYRGWLAPISEVPDDDAAQIIAQARTSLTCAFPAEGGRIRLPEPFRRAISIAGHGSAHVKFLYSGLEGARSAPHWDFPHEARSVRDAVPHCVAIDGSVIVMSPSGRHRQGRSLKIENEFCTATYLAFFHNIWHLAKPVPAPSDECPHCRIANLIVQALTQGATDERAAPRLGMSVRTYRRHVARIMEELQVTSRFQAGLKIANEGMPCRHR